MKPKRNSMLSALMLSALVMSVTGCASNSQPSNPPAVVEPPAIPSLPQSARQSPLPSFCSPTCLQALTTLRESWQKLLIEVTPQDLPANESMTR